MSVGLEANGLDRIKTVCDSEFLNLTVELEETGRALFPGAMSRDAYIEKNAIRSILFLIDIQKWKNQYFGKYRDFLQLDAPEKIAGTIFDFFQAGSDWDKLQVLCQITRTGQGFNQTCLKKSTMIAQFLDPVAWGVMDWRMISILGFSGSSEFAKDTFSFSSALFDGPLSEATFLRALKTLRSCRCDELPRAQDVSLSLYFSSLDLWPAHSQDASLESSQH